MLTCAPCRRVATVRFKAQGSSAWEKDPLVVWNGITAAHVERNVFVANTTAARTRDAWFNGRPCAATYSGQGVMPSSCTWNLADNFKTSGSTVGNNVYFNASNGGGGSATFPGGCKETALGECGPNGHPRSSFKYGCACASFAAWQSKGYDTGSLLTDPMLVGTLRLVSSPAAIAIGIDPLTELARVGPDWKRL